MTLNEAKNNLVTWFKENQRELPWRANRDPYRIWISETMLQQTTTTAVIPYFERFLKTFPSLEALAKAPVEKVIEAWAGLGYYSRARNLHKSAKALHELPGFPRSHTELADLPGFGPYTSRAVSSLAFGEPVGVVDGNVIRVFARIYAQSWQWWKTKARNEIQDLADAWVKDVNPHEMNQALMELGRTICTPKSPSCLLCPVRKFCQALKKGDVTKYPSVRPKRERETWVWKAHLEIKGKKIRIAKSDQVPFLRGQWCLPGMAQRVETRPKRYHYKHTITHHDIFVTVSREVFKLKGIESKWIPLEEIKQHVPASLVQKALTHMSTDNDQRLFDSSKNSPAANRKLKQHRLPANRR